VTDLPADPDASATRRSLLMGIKLRALVRDHLADAAVPEAQRFMPGAALQHGDEAWVLLDDRPAERLGAAIAWAVRAGATRLHVVSESGSGVLARRAGQFTMPITVWHADQRDLWPAVAEPLVPPAPVPEHHRPFAEQMIAGGAEVAEEHGVLAGEVRGLEVCRVVDDAYTGDTRLEVGVGVHDREAFAMLHGDAPETESLARIVAAVAPHRRLDADPHPLNRLARERLLRADILDAPGRVEAQQLHTVAPPVPRRNLKDPVPCVAAGHDRHGRPLVVVCSTGVDLDLIPFAADARLAVDTALPALGSSRLIIVTPRRDRLKLSDEVAALLTQPAELLSLD
jgi:hypothetical protein